MKLKLRKGEHEISPLEQRMLSEAFPKVDVPEQLRLMSEWCRANPQKRKTERGVRRFINAWLSRSQQSAKGPKTTVYAAAHKKFTGDETKTSAEEKQRGLDQLARYAAMQKRAMK